MNAAETVLDQGTLIVDGAGFPIDRREAFVCIGMPNGNRRINSRVESLDGAYLLECQFDYDPQLAALAAHGKSRQGEREFTVSIERATGSTARLLVVHGKDQQTQVLDAPADCLIDLEPSAMPMWMMTQRMPEQARSSRRFGWIGRSLISDRVLEGGSAELQPARPVELELDGRPVRLLRYDFEETLPIPGGGRFTMGFNLWMDAAGWLRLFRVNGRRGAIYGVREGHESLRAAAEADEI